MAPSVTQPVEIWLREHGNRDATKTARTRTPRSLLCKSLLEMVVQTGVEQLKYQRTWSRGAGESLWVPTPRQRATGN